MLIDNLSDKLLLEAMKISLMEEGGSRLSPYDVFKWWSRRFVSLTRLILASLITDDEQEVLTAILGKPTNSLINQAKEKLIFDPFCGAGTIPIEAVRLGFNAVGHDINEVAVNIAKATHSLIGNSSTCRKKLECLVDSFEKAWSHVKHIWTLPDGKIIIHTFLARCPPCKAPIWLSSKRDGSGIRKVLLIDKDSGNLYWTDRIPEGLSPTSPSIDLSGIAKNLPLVSPSYRAYAVELFDPRSTRREIISLINKKNIHVSEFIEWSVKEANEMLRRRYSDFLRVKVPLLQETKRLYRKGILFMHELFTSRQLISLLEFIHAARPICRTEAALIAGNTARTASLLAFYYQPYSKINPGLQIKSYWIPDNPTELNPFAHDLIIKKNDLPLKTLGRGTIVTYIRKYFRACLNIEKKQYVKYIGKAEFKAVDSLVGKYPEEVYAIVTDPPYPGQFKYRELSLLYSYFLGKRPENIHVHEIDTLSIDLFINSMRQFIRNLEMYNDRVYLVMMLGIKEPRLAHVITKITKYANMHGFGLSNIYWFLGESLGKLGRSKTRGVFIIVFRKGIASLPGRAVNSLYKSIYLVREVGKIKKNLIDVGYEAEIIYSVIRELELLT